MNEVRFFACEDQYVDKSLAPAPVTYVNKWLKGDPDTPKFLGNPSTEMDQAWHELLSGTAIRFSEEELILANNATSIRLQDGGYVAGLGISHSLHCVVSITYTSSPSTKNIRGFSDPSHVQPSFWEII